ncbi:MAG: putative DNA-binding domain-containing protein, partial [Myxococcales bacterium]|nr:putative DNA-binding domain-containing protein [Myxococcales bacterium]
MASGLRGLQAEFLGAVLDGAPARAAPRVIGDARLDAVGRVEVYARMYRDRMVDALAEDFPKLVAIIGGERFAALVIEYLVRHPSRSWTLRDAGDRFARFLAGRAATPPWWAELAALEWARVDAYDAIDEAAMTRDDLAALPVEAWPT